MDINIAKEFMSKLIVKAPEYGFDDAESCFMNSVSMSLDVLNGEVSSYENSSEQGVSFRGKINGKMGIANTTRFDDASVDFLLSEAKSNASIIDDEDEEFIYCDENNKTLHYTQLSGNANKNTYETFSRVGLSLEKAILASDSNIVSVDYLSISCGQGPTIILNSKGLDTFKDSDYITVFAEGRAEVDGVVKTAGYFWFGNDIDKFNEDNFVKVLNKKLMSKFGASSVKSGTYDCILTNEAFISLISTFFGVFSSYSMQKGLSLLAGKEGEVIASDKLTIKEIPMYDKALIKVSFDSEGVITQEKSIIESGVFKTALYNLKTANIAGRESTGNGFRSSYASSVSISFTNLVVMSGSKTFDQLCETVGNGLVITDLNGLHAGVNTISGDFSLFCEGFLINDGKIVRPVEQITIADNFFDVIKKISDVGNDVISYPDGAGEMFSPSVLIKDISVSGDE